MTSGIHVVAVLRTPDVISIIGSLVGAVLLFAAGYAMVLYLIDQGRQSEPPLRVPALPPESTDLGRSSTPTGFSENGDRDIMSSQHELPENEE